MKKPHLLLLPILLMAALPAVAQIVFTAQQYDYRQRAFDLTLENRADTAVILTGVGADFITLFDVSYLDAGGAITLKASARYTLPLFKDTLTDADPALVLPPGDPIRITVGFEGNTARSRRYLFDAGVQLVLDNGTRLKTDYWLISSSDPAPDRLPTREEMQNADARYALHHLRYFPDWPPPAVKAIIQDVLKTGEPDDWKAAIELIAIFHLEDLKDSLLAVPEREYLPPALCLPAVRSLYRLSPAAAVDLVRSRLAADLASSGPADRDASRAGSLVQGLTVYMPDSARLLFASLLREQIPLALSPEPGLATYALAALCDGLIALEDTSSIDLLLAVWQSDDEFLAESIGRTLEHREGGFSSDALKTRSYKRVWAGKLLALAVDPHCSNRPQALAMLYKFREALDPNLAAPLLLPLLSDADPEVQWEAVNHFRLLQPLPLAAVDSLIGRLVAGLDYEDDWSYHLLADGLAKYDDQEAVIPRLRTALADHLAYLDDPDATRPRVMGLATLGMVLVEVEDSSSLPLVRTLLEHDPHYWMSGDILYEIRHKYDEHYRPDPAYIPLLKEAYPPLLSHPNPQARRDALTFTCLSYDDPDFLTGVLRTALSDEEPYVRVAAAQWAGRKKLRALALRLRELYRTAEPGWARSSYCEALEAMGEECID